MQPQAAFRGKRGQGHTREPVHFLVPPLKQEEQKDNRMRSTAQAVLQLPTWPARVRKSTGRFCAGVWDSAQSIRHCSVCAGCWQAPEPIESSAQAVAGACWGGTSQHDTWSLHTYILLMASYINVLQTSHVTQTVQRCPVRS